MPDYSVDVIDLGLTVTQALAMGLEPEEHTRKKELDADLVDELLYTEPRALQYFTGNKEYLHKDGKLKPIWKRCKRFELDKMTAPEAVALIEEGLNWEGIFGKIVPPDDELPELAENIYRDAAARWADAALEEVLEWKAIREELADVFMERFKLESSVRYIRARFKKDDALSWKNALRGVLADIHHRKHTDDLNEAVKEKVVEALQKEAG